MHTLRIDHLGQFVGISRKSTYLITAIDAFTKFISMKTVSSTKTEPAILFLKEIFGLFGIPQRLMSQRNLLCEQKVSRLRLEMWH